MEPISPSNKNHKIGSANQTLVKGIERILTSVESLKKTSGKNGYFPLFKNVHEAWRVRGAKEKEREIANFRKKVSK